MACIVRRELFWTLLGLILLPAVAQANDPRLVVHEWGTFTALDNDLGQQLGGINIDDEPVPGFVYNLGRNILASPRSPTFHYDKGVPRRHPYVVVRLETPVIYFYPPKDQKDPIKLDVDVALRGGWLTEYYPKAAVVAPGSEQKTFPSVPITADTTGRLSWKNLQIGGGETWPYTEKSVWLEPRKTNSVPVQTPEGEAEKYLFYRGVGNFKAPLAVSHDLQSSRLAIRSNFEEALPLGGRAEVSAAWLVHIRPDRSAAFRSLPPFSVGYDSKEVVASVSSRFEDAEYDSANVDRLQSAMRKALMAEGLFDDEAQAMLNTWNRAYFQQPGLRLFFCVPRVWTDHRMPLNLSLPADITRVMVGRLELISPEQRTLLQRLAQASTSDGKWLSALKQSSPDVQRFMAGHSDFGDLGTPIPADYQMYLDLGRFRNALVLAEAEKPSNESLRKFIRVYRLESLQVPAPATSPRRTVAANVAPQADRAPQPRKRPRL